MDPRKFWTLCRLHDWLYMMSDDPGVYRAGDQNSDRLEALADSDPRLFEIYVAWREHAYECGPRPPEPKMEE